MYKALFNIQTECLDVTSQELFTPFLNCYFIHSIMLSVNGILFEENRVFSIVGEKTVWNDEHAGFKLDYNDNLVFDINYFYIRPENIEVLNFLIDSTYSNPLKSKEIISKHYIEGQFSLDNGLYKNAVLNFGTTLEGILNKTLSNASLDNLIQNYHGNADKNFMHSIRSLRNKVHPNKIINSQDITRKEAIETRNQLEIIMKTI